MKKFHRSGLILGFVVALVPAVFAQTTDTAGAVATDTSATSMSSTTDTSTTMTTYTETTDTATTMEPAPVVVQEDNDFPWGLLGLLGLAGLMKRPRRIVETHTTVVPPRVDPPRMDPPRNDPPRPNPTNRV